jgi:Fic family protein
MSAESGLCVSTTLAGEAIRAFVPDPLPPRLGAEAQIRLEPLLRAAKAALEKLEIAGEMIPSLDWFIYAFVRKEALLSSQIEGTQATLADVLAYEHAEQVGSSTAEDIEEVTNYVAAVNYAFGEIHTERGLPISVRLFNECHRILMQGVRGGSKQPGELRRSQSWIGGSRPGNAAFVPPPPERVADLLKDLETYLHGKDDLDPLLRVALVHAQFETIHPYLDGNGRLGRMLIALLLDHWRQLKSPLLYLSLYLKQNQAEYYRRLTAARSEGDWAGWLEFFLEGVARIAREAMETARALHQQVTEDRKRLLATPGANISAVQMFEHLPSRPVISMPLVTELLSVSKPTAGKAIESLQAAGILVAVDERKRNRLYRYDAYLRRLE